MLSDSGLKYEFTSNDVVVIKLGGGEEPKEAEEVVVEELIVTGSRLNLETHQLSKAVITLTAKDLMATGEPSLGRALAREPGASGCHGVI